MLCLTPVFGHCLLLENISINLPPELRGRCSLKNVMHTRVTKAEVFVESAQFTIKAGISYSISLHIFVECLFP